MLNKLQKKDYLYFVYERGDIREKMELTKIRRKANGNLLRFVKLYNSKALYFSI